MNTTLISAKDPAFLARLEAWLEETGEILLLIRYSRAAGSKDFELYSSFPALRVRIEELPQGTSVIAFKDAGLPQRGVVDERFIADCLNAIPDGSEYLVLQTQRTVYGKAWWYQFDAGESHEQLREALEESRGLAVAVGLYPPWLGHREDVLSAIAPDDDCIPRPGIY